MHIDPSSTIAGVPALKVRDFLRRDGDGLLRADHMAARLKIDLVKANAVLDELMNRRMAERVPDGKRGEDLFQLTLLGRSFSLASGGRPLSRSTAQRKVNELLQRVAKINEGDHFLYVVRRVLVFGSFLSDSQTLNDVDVAVELTPRHGDKQVQRAHEDKRISHAIDTGRRFSNFLQQICWPQHETLLFLKSRSRAIALHTTDDAILKQAKARQIYPAGR